VQRYIFFVTKRYNPQIIAKNSSFSFVINGKMTTFARQI
jgi:hypothetical protein